MKIEVKSNYGNFDYRLTAEVGDSVNAETVSLCKQGLLNIAYRVAGSAVDKALGVKERKAVNYSEADAERINAAVSGKLKELEAKDSTLKALEMSFAVTGEHEWGATVESKFTEEKKLAERHESADDLEEWLEGRCGYGGQTHGEDGEYHPAMLAAIRVYKIRMLKEL